MKTKLNKHVYNRKIETCIYHRKGSVCFTELFLNIEKDTLFSYAIWGFEKRSINRRRKEQSIVYLSPCSVCFKHSLKNRLIEHYNYNLGRPKNITINKIIGNFLEYPVFEKFSIDWVISRDKNFTDASVLIWLSQAVLRVTCSNLLILCNRIKIYNNYIRGTI